MPNQAATDSSTTDSSTTDSSTAGGTIDNPNPLSDSAKSRRPRSRRPLAIMVGIVLALIVIFVVAAIQGHVEGTEFSPTHFQARRFEYYEMPGLRWQMTPIRRRGLPIEAALYLTQRSLVNVPPSRQKSSRQKSSRQKSSVDQSSSRSTSATIDPDSTKQAFLDPFSDGDDIQWDLASVRRGGQQRFADAGLLTRWLLHHDGADPVCERWSKQNPSAAKFLWPIVQSLARQNLYMFIPGVLEIAMVNDVDANHLSSRLKPHLRKQYVSLISDMRQTGRVKQADQLAEQQTRLLRQMEDVP